jgi:LPXTG-site transpeptidase (sortase) family protein
MKRLLVIMCLLVILAPIAPAHAAPMGWMITPVYAPIHTAPIVDNYHQIGDSVYHLEGTTWIDDGWGRVVIAGHNPGIFAPLIDLEIGALIIIMADGIVHKYRVTERIVTGDDTRYLAPTNTPTLTLITCLERGETWLILNAEEVQ